MKRFFFPALLLIFLPYRLLAITDPIRHVNQFRQAQTATVALNFYRHGITPWQTEIDIFGKGKERYLTLEFPLYETLIALLYRMFFVSDMWGRAVSIAAGLIGGWYLYRLVLVLTKDRRWAWFSAFFFFLAPINMFYQRDILLESTVIATLLAGTYYACIWIQKRKRTVFVLSIALLSLGFVQKGMYGPFWLPILGLFAWPHLKEKKDLLLFFSLCIMPLAVLFFWQHHVNVINTANGHSYFSTSDAGHLDWNFGTWADRFSVPFWQIRIKNLLNGVFLKPGLLFFAIGFLVLWRRKQALVWYGWLFSEILYFLLLFKIQSHNNYQMILVPVCAVFMAGGWLYLVRRAELLGQRVGINYGVPFAAAMVCSLLLFRANASAHWDNDDDHAWYGRLQQVAHVVPHQSWGILVNPGGDWNSVYTYIPHLHLKEAPVETVTPATLVQWRQEGYTYMILHEYASYPGYLREVAPRHTLDFLQDYPTLLQLEDFRVLPL